MTKEHYLAQKKSIKDQIDYFENQQKELYLKYIEENKPFNIGDRVNKVGGDNFGYVVGFELSWNDSVRTKLVKEKKDGTPSKQSMYIWSSDELQLANK